MMSLFKTELALSKVRYPSNIKNPNRILKQTEITRHFIDVATLFLSVFKGETTK